MIVKEFSNSFDTALSAWFHTLNAGETMPDALVFDEYEKSVFLTKAQDSLVIDYYEGNAVPSFEEKERIREALDALVNTYDTSTRVEGKSFVADEKHKSALFTIPDDLLWIIVEQATYANPLPCCPRMAGKTVSVIPRTHDEYHRMIDNPFRGPSRKRVIRLNAANNIVELISGPFKGERAKVVRIDESREEVVLELIEAAVPIPVTVKADQIRIIQKEAD